MTSQQYIDAMYSMFVGPDDTEIRCRSVELVSVRKEQPCMCPAHEWSGGTPHHTVKPGDKAVRDKAIADGEWGSCFVCLPCLSSWSDHCESDTEHCSRG